ncbi:hypothetical protein BJ944DRAFT_235425 [Cunninghamella echinulata]|nr:hypothetical protein BJ944DRAFT_235425 [Cunninghamella echinulata]
MNDIDVCYESDPLKPILMAVRRIHANAFLYKKYQNEDLLTNEEVTSIQENKLASEVQLIQFLNEVFIPTNPFNDIVYEHKKVTINDIFSIALRYTNILDNKSTLSFAKWSSRKEILFSKVEAVRKTQKDSSGHKVRFRDLYIMKEVYRDNVASAIIDYLPNYTKYVKTLISEGYQLVGYARKSPGTEDDTTRAKLLQRMVNNLKERSYAEKVFISTKSLSNEAITSRDMNSNDSIINMLDKVDGNTQEMLSVISELDKVCLIVLDYSGLSTNCLDIKHFIRNNVNIKKIIIDCYPFGEGVISYDRDSILEDSEVLNKFNSRNKYRQRSK